MLHASSSPITVSTLRRSTDFPLDKVKRTFVARARGKWAFVLLAYRDAGVCTKEAWRLPPSRVKRNACQVLTVAEIRSE